MTAVMPDLGMLDMSGFEFDPACEHSRHVINGDGPAKWIVSLGVFPGEHADGCMGLYSGLCCDGCMEHMRTTSNGVLCRCRASSIRPYRNALFGVHPLRKGE